MQSDEIASSWLNNQAVRSAIHAEMVHACDITLILVEGPLKNTKFISIFCLIR